MTDAVHTKSRTSYILRSFAFAKPFWQLLAATLFLNTIFSTLTALTVATIKPIFELIFSAKIKEEAIPVQSTFLAQLKTEFYSFLKNIIISPDNIVSTLLNLGIFIIILFLLKNFFKYWGLITNAVLEENIIKSIREKLFAKLTSLDIQFFNKTQSGAIISTLTNDVNVVNSTTVSAFTGLLREIIQVVLFFVLLLSISPSLTFIAFSSGIATVLILRIATNYLRKYATRMQGAMADFTSILQESLAGFRIIKAYSLENHINEKFFSQLQRYFRSSIKFQSIISLVPSINEIVAIVALVVVFLVGGGRVIEGTMAAEDLMLFLFSLFSIMSPVATVVHNISQFQRGYVSSKRVFDILDQPTHIKSGDKCLSEFKEEIEFRNVSFSYDTEEVLENVSFTVRKGQKIALVGPSGSGKSTVVDLLVRLYDPSSGEILLDDENIRNLDIQSFRSLFGIVSQEVILFHDTIENNIRVGNFNATKDEIIQSTKISNSYDFIMKLPNGFDTIIGERGVLLSGGERQRIAIARALVRNPQILIFDEATSALDSESEKIVQQAINQSLQNRTAIIVAHRLATIIDCDEILVFDKGKIVERGTHRQLLELDGLYKKLYSLQVDVI